MMILIYFVFECRKFPFQPSLVMSVRVPGAFSQIKSNSKSESSGLSYLAAQRQRFLVPSELALFFVKHVSFVVPFWAQTKNLPITG